MDDAVNQSVFFPLHPNLPNSLDPLDADRHENLPVARMLYATPLEISNSNTLVSQVLSKFEYFQNTNTMTWIVRDHLTYDDGSSIRADDVAFAVSRMIFARPKFPVITAIDGVKEWLATDTPLKTFPSGIKVTGNTIEIKFDRKIINPFFRFTLELFSIIPRQCVNLQTNKILCKKIPTSGNYVINSRTDNEISFHLRKTPDGGHETSAPKFVVFRYRPSASFEPTDNGIFHLSEFSLRLKKVDLRERGFSTKSAPASDFISILISPLVKPFDRPQCRRVFAEIVRSILKEDLSAGVSTEPSLFPKIIPGYLSPAELTETSADLSDCGKYLRQHPIKWARFPKNEHYFFDSLIEKAAQRLGLNLQEPFILSDSGDEWPGLFNSGAVAFYPFMTGFWAMDPIGDVRMLFTPGLHEDLDLISRDSHLQKLLVELETEVSGEPTRKKMEQINKYIFDQAIMNPILQFKKIYATRGLNKLHEFPLAVQQPYPWQVFGH